jgi:hypothetical protein
MTSDFDNLMGIWEMSKENIKFKPIAEWLADLCISEADTKKEGWNFDTWMKSSWAETVKAVHGEDALKWNYLNDCHDALDHKEFHLKVFKPDTQTLIRIVYNLFKGHDTSFYDLKRNVKRHLPKLLELLRAFGTEEDKYYIKLKGIERKDDFM